MEDWRMATEKEDEYIQRYFEPKEKRSMAFLSAAGIVLIIFAVLSLKVGFDFMGIACAVFFGFFAVMSFKSAAKSYNRIYNIRNRKYHVGDCKIDNINVRSSGRLVTRRVCATVKTASGDTMEVPFLTSLFGGPMRSGEEATILYLGSDDIELISRV